MALREIVLTSVKRSQPGEQILQKKGRGRIIHVSDFVEEDNRHLIVRNDGGDIIKDA
jgi:hypothetical protein